MKIHCRRVLRRGRSIHPVYLFPCESLIEVYTIASHTFKANHALSMTSFVHACISRSWVSYHMPNPPFPPCRSSQYTHLPNVHAFTPPNPLLPLLYLPPSAPSSRTRHLIQSLILLHLGRVFPMDVLDHLHELRAGGVAELLVGGAEDLVEDGEELGG